MWRECGLDSTPSQDWKSLTQISELSKILLKIVLLWLCASEKLVKSSELLFWGNTDIVIPATFGQLLWVEWDLLGTGRWIQWSRCCLCHQGQFILITQGIMTPGPAPSLHEPRDPQDRARSRRLVGCLALGGLNISDNLIDCYKKGNLHD